MKSPLWLHSVNCFGLGIMALAFPLVIVLTSRPPETRPEHAEIIFGIAGGGLVWFGLFVAAYLYRARGTPAVDLG